MRHQTHYLIHQKHNQSLTSFLEALKHNNKYPIFSSYIASSKNKMTEEFYSENNFLQKTDSDNNKTYIMEKDVKCNSDFYGEIKWN